MPNNTINCSRNNSVFKSEFSDGSIFYSAKVKAPGTTAASLKWAENIKRHGNSWRLIQATITHKGLSNNSLVCSELSKKESQLIKCHLIRKARELNLTVLNVEEETFIEMNGNSLHHIQIHCKCGFNRAKYLVALANELTNQ